MSVPPWGVADHATPCIVSAEHLGSPTTREKRYTYDVLRCVSNTAKGYSIKTKRLLSGSRSSPVAQPDLYFYGFFTWPVASIVITIEGIVYSVSSTVLIPDHRLCLERYKFSNTQRESARRYLKIFAKTEVPRFLMVVKYVVTHRIRNEKNLSRESVLVQRICPGLHSIRCMPCQVSVTECPLMFSLLSPSLVARTDPNPNP